MTRKNKSRRSAAGKHGGDHPASPPSFPPPPPPGSSSADIANWLGHGGVILVLFETPSGFALLKYYGCYLFRSGALKDTWVRFMTKRRNSKIHCLFDEAVMELMWGLKHIIKSLVPTETCELTTEDRRHMSKGMQLILKKYGFGVEPEMVDEDLITIATALYKSDYRVNSFAEFLHRGGKYPNVVSGIDCQNWDLQKLAAALKLLSCPEDEIETGTSNEMLSEDMKSTLVDQAHKHEPKLHKGTCLNINKEILFAHAVRSKALVSLKAKGACATQ